MIDDRSKRGARAAHLAAMEAIAAAQGPVQQLEPCGVQGWALHVAWLATQFQPELWPPQLGEMLLEATAALIRLIQVGSNALFRQADINQLSRWCHAGLLQFVAARLVGWGAWLSSSAPCLPSLPYRL